MIAEENAKPEEPATVLPPENVPAETAPEPEEEEKQLPESEGGRKWYVLQTYSGQEDKVRDNVERQIKAMSMEMKVFRVLVPTEQTAEIRDGKRIEKVKKLFPGYVFIEMVLDDETWYVIRQTPGVARFIGERMRPTPVTDREMQRVLKQIGLREEKLKVEFEVAESVRIVGGPFRGYPGTVAEINAQKGKLRVLISIFGRDTPVEIDFDQVERMV